jgi:hypothetical protein
MSAFGWPFLVGRGRRTGHRVLLAPDFLVEARDHGILEAASEQVEELTSSAGRRLSVRCSTHEVSADDIAAAGNPRDEHGRPLRLIYGVVAMGVEPANADLLVALESSLDTYRRFLKREDDFEVEPAPTFPLTARTPLVAPVPAAADRPGPRSVAVLSGVGLIAVLTIVLSVLWGRSNPEPTPGTPCPTSATNDVVGTAPNASFSAAQPSSAGQCGTAATSRSGRPVSSGP